MENKPWKPTEKVRSAIRRGNKSLKEAQERVNKDYEGALERRKLDKATTDS